MSFQRRLEIDVFADLVNALVAFALQIDLQSNVVFIWSDAGAVKSIALSGNGINKRYILRRKTIKGLSASLVFYLMVFTIHRLRNVERPFETADCNRYDILLFKFKAIFFSRGFMIFQTV